MPGGEGGGSWGKSLGPEGPRANLASAWPSPLGQQGMWLKCRWTGHGGWRGRGWLQARDHDPACSP